VGFIIRNPLIKIGLYLYFDKFELVIKKIMQPKMKKSDCIIEVAISIKVDTK